MGVGKDLENAGGSWGGGSLELGGGRHEGRPQSMVLRFTLRALRREKQGFPECL